MDEVHAATDVRNERTAGTLPASLGACEDPEPAYPALAPVLIAAE